MKKTINRLFSATLILALLLNVSGCKPEKQKNLVFESMIGIDNIDPQLADNETEFQIVYNSFEGLFKYDKNGAIANGITNSYSVSPDELKYSFELSRDAKWADGSNVLAQDFVFAIQRALSPETKAPYSYTLLPIKNASKVLKGKKNATDLGIKAISDTKLEITLEYPINYLPKLFATPITMPCKESFFNETNGYYGLNRKSILCNGFYMVNAWNSDYCSITTNSEYLNKKETQISDVYFYFSDNDELIESIEKDDVDLSVFNNFTIDFLDSADIKYSTEKQFDTVNSLVFNDDADVFSDKIIEALKRSIKYEIPTEVKKKYGIEEANSIYPSIIEGAEEIDSKQKSKIPDNDARDLFFEGCKEIDAERTLPPLTILYIDDPASTYVIKLIASNWQNIFGLTINLEAVETKEELTSRIASKSYQIAVVPSIAATDSATSYLQQFTTTSTLNFYNFKSISFDKNLKKLGNLSDEKYLKQLEKLSNYVFDTDYTLPLFSSSKHFYIDSEIKIPINKTNKIIYFAYCE